MQNTGIIHLDSGLYVQVRLSELERWLPGIHDLVYLNRFNAGDVVRQMTNSFDGQVHHTVTYETIMTALEELMKHLESKSPVVSSTGRDLQRSIEVRLRKDLSVADTVGLRRSRERFMIFCLLALLTRSQALAESMMGFLGRFLWEVVYGEERGLFKEWCMGIVALQGLVPPQILEELLCCFSGLGDRAYKPRLQPAYQDSHAKMAMRYMMQAQHYPLLNRHRGKAPLMLEGPTGYLRDRLLSVGRPRRHHRRHGQFQIIRPWAQPNEYFDEVGKMQYQQQEMNMKVDHIVHRLESLF